MQSIKTRVILFQYSYMTFLSALGTIAFLAYPELLLKLTRETLLAISGTLMLGFTVYFAQEPIVYLVEKIKNAKHQRSI